MQVYYTAVRLLASLLCFVIPSKEIRGLVRKKAKLYTLQGKNAKRVEKFLSGGGKLLVEFGPGSAPRAGWLGVDVTGKSEITFDMEKIDRVRNPLPFPDNSLDGIHSSHFLEHFVFPEPLRTIVSECHRCLKLGGTFDAVVPNMAMYIDAYIRNDLSVLFKENPVMVPYMTGCRMDIIAYVASMKGYHKYMFDTENLQQLLRNAGFRDVHPREFNPDFDLENRRYQSIYVVGTK